MSVFVYVSLYCVCVRVSLSVRFNPKIYPNSVLFCQTSLSIKSSRAQSCVQTFTEQNRKVAQHYVFVILPPPPHTHTHTDRCSPQTWANAGHISALQHKRQNTFYPSNRVSFAYLNFTKLESVVRLPAEQTVCLFTCLTSQQHASVSQGRICSDNFSCFHTEDRSCRSNFLPHQFTVY